MKCAHLFPAGWNGEFLLHGLEFVDFIRLLQVLQVVVVIFEEHAILLLLFNPLLLCILINIYTRSETVKTQSHYHGSSNVYLNLGYIYASLPLIFVTDLLVKPRLL